MKVIRARLFEVALPLREPFTISGGTMAVRRSLIVELTDDSGNRGYGESAPFELPFYSSETTASARACLEALLLPSVIGQDLASSSATRDRLDLLARGNRMAKAGVETAWWDLQASREGVSLADLVSRRLEALGIAGATRSRRPVIDCGVALGIPPGNSGAVLREWVRDALRAGYRRIKLKVRPGWDEEPVRVTQEELRASGKDLPVWVDANGAYLLDRDLSALRRLDDLRLVFLEQPLPEDALWDSCELGRQLKTPICFDESLTSDEVARQVLEMGGPGIWNIKIQRVGGLEEACRIYARAVRAGVRLWGGTMPETGLGAQAMLALGGHSGFVFPSDIEPSDRWYEAGTDLVPLTMAPDGTMAVPSKRPVFEPDERVGLIADLF